MHYAKIMQIKIVIYGMTSIVRILIRYNDHKGRISIIITRKSITMWHKLHKTIT